MSLVRLQQGRCLAALDAPSRPRLPLTSLYRDIRMHDGSGNSFQRVAPTGRSHSRKAAGPARSRGIDRGVNWPRLLHLAATACLHPPGQAQGSRAGARSPRRRLGVLPRQQRSRRTPARADPLVARKHRRCPAARRRGTLAGRACTARPRGRLGRHRGGRHGTSTTRPAAPGKRSPARCFNCWETGDVLDIASGDGVTAELLAPHARSIVCVDASERVAEAAAKRLANFSNVTVQYGDMHALHRKRTASTLY